MHYKDKHTYMCIYIYMYLCVYICIHIYSIYVYMYICTDKYEYKHIIYSI